LFVQTIESPTFAWIGLGVYAPEPKELTIAMITCIGVGGAGAGSVGAGGAGSPAGIGSSRGRLVPPPAPGDASGVRVDGDAGSVPLLHPHAAKAHVSARTPDHFFNGMSASVASAMPEEIIEKT